MAAMFGRLGIWELVLILVIALVIFGPSKLPDMGRAIGKSLREFRKAAREIAEDIEEEKAARSSPGRGTVEQKGEEQGPAS